MLSRHNQPTPITSDYDTHSSLPSTTPLHHINTLFHCSSPLHPRKNDKDTLCDKDALFWFCYARRQNVVLPIRDDEAHDEIDSTINFSNDGISH